MIHTDAATKKNGHVDKAALPHNSAFKEMSYGLVCSVTQHFIRPPKRTSSQKRKKRIRFRPKNKIIIKKITTVPGLPHLLIGDTLPGRSVETAHIWKNKTTVENIVLQMVFIISVLIPGILHQCGERT